MHASHQLDDTFIPFSLSLLFLSTYRSHFHGLTSFFWFSYLFIPSIVIIILIAIAYIDLQASMFTFAWFEVWMWMQIFFFSEYWINSILEYYVIYVCEFIAKCVQNKQIMSHINRLGEEKKAKWWLSASKAKQNNVLHWMICIHDEHEKQDVKTV